MKKVYVVIKWCYGECEGVVEIYDTPVTEEQLPKLPHGESYSVEEWEVKSVK